MRSPTPAPRCADNRSSFTSTRNLHAHGIALLVLMAFSAGIMPGCAIRTPAAADRNTTEHASTEIAWPARWTDDLRTVADAMPRRYAARNTIEQYRKNDEGEWESRKTELALHEVVRAQAHGMGVIREVRRARGDNAPMRIIRVAHRHGNHAGGDDDFDAQRIHRFNFHSWRDQPNEEFIHDDSRDAYWRKLTSLATLEMPVTDEVRGLVIALGPHTNTPWDLRERLPERGWAVLRLSGTRPAGESQRPTFEFHNDTSIEDAATTIAETIDHWIAEHAYAAEAAVEYLRDNVSAFRHAPVVVVGVSRGALIAPAVAARLDDRADAVVLAIGGANLLAIAQSTTFVNHELLTINWLDANGSARALSRAERRALNDAYLNASRLDPYHVAPHLRDTPTLLMTAAFDRVIPASTGRVLHERLGKPERWHYLLGHVLTYWLHNRNPDRVIDWIEDSVRKPVPRIYVERAVSN